MKVLTRRLTLISLALIAFVATASDATAGFNARLLKTYGNDTTVRVYFQELKNGKYYNKSTTAKAAQFTWQVTSGQGPNPATQTFQSFCVDLMQSVQKNQGFDSTPLQASMGLAQGNLVSSTQVAMIEAYWNTNISKITNKNEASAFQIGLWELVYERTEDKSKLDVKNGNFHIGINSKDKTYKEILNLANSWLQCTNYGIPPTGHPPLVVVTSPNGQDQVTPGVDPPLAPVGRAVPAPPALMLTLSGLLGFGVLSAARRHFGFAC
jgi:hypothetical protein